MEYRGDIQKPGNCATFIYTSGTTGPPKAVMISHDSYTYICANVAKATNAWRPQMEGKGRLLSMLPLSHVAAQLIDLVIGVRAGANLFFTDPSALQGNLVKFLQASRPYICIYKGPFSSQFPEFGRKCKKKSWRLVLRLPASKGRQLTGPRAKLLMEHTHN